MSAPDRPRVAIVGNMNNAGFAMMRYFRDLGADAYLLPYSTDGVGPHAHFAPEADTWEWERWARYVTPLAAPNTSAAINGDFRTGSPPPSRKVLNAQLAGFDYYVGSGVAPALFERLGRALDIFYPYGIGIEFYGDPAFIARKNAFLPRRMVLARVRRLQARGIRSARMVLNAELGPTQTNLDTIGARTEAVGLVAVYNRAPSTGIDVPSETAEAIRRMKESDFALFSSARLLFVRDPSISAADWSSYSKNSDWAIRGLAGFVARNPGVTPVLVMMAYGPDVEAAKRLAEELDVARFLVWLPTKPRREIKLLLDACDVGVGQFYINPGILWGGTGWEILASGKPMLHAFNFSESEFAASFGHPAPPTLDAKSAEDCAAQLDFAYRSPEAMNDMAEQAALWFDRYGGIGLAERWLETLRALPDTGHD